MTVPSANGRCPSEGGFKWRNGIGLEGGRRESFRMTMALVRSRLSASVRSVAIDHDVVPVARNQCNLTLVRKDLLTDALRAR